MSNGHAAAPPVAKSRSRLVTPAIVVIACDGRRLLGRDIDFNGHRRPMAVSRMGYVRPYRSGAIRSATTAAAKSPNPVATRK